MIQMGRGRGRIRWWMWVISVLALLAGAFVILQPRIVEQSPAPGASGISSSRPIEILFNRPMNRSSVERRLEIEPAIPGEISWQDQRLVFQPSTSWPEGESIKVQMRAGAVSKLSMPLLANKTWQFQIGQPRIVFLNNRGGPSQLEVMVLTEVSSQRLVEAPLGVVDYDLEVGLGALITLEPRPDGSSALLLRDLQGQLDRELHRCPAEVRCRQPVLSPAGDWLAWQQQPVSRAETGVVENGPRQTLVLSLELGASPQRLPEQAELHSPQWIDSQRLAAYNESRAALLIYQSDPQGQWQSIGQITHQLGEQWTWSPEGRFVVFPEVILLDDSRQGVDFYSHLLRVEVESGLSTDLSGSNRDLVEDASPAYSPDGLRIAFARKSLLPEEWTLGRQLWIMTSDGSGAMPLTNEPNSNHAGMRWHPEGNRLLYVRFNQAELNTPSQIWWYDFTTEVNQMLIEGGFDPRWMP